MSHSKLRLIIAFTIFAATAIASSCDCNTKGTDSTNSGGGDGGATKGSFLLSYNHELDTTELPEPAWSDITIYYSGKRQLGPGEQPQGAADEFIDSEAKYTSVNTNEPWKKGPHLVKDLNGGTWTLEAKVGANGKVHQCPGMVLNPNGNNPVVFNISKDGIFIGCSPI